MRFTFIDAAKAEFPIQRLCQGLEVSQSGYFAWRSRPACQRQRDDLVLLAHVRSAFRELNGTSGSPRMTRELQDQGLPIGRRRTARLMRENGLRARQKRRFKRTTDSHHAFPIAPNLLERTSRPSARTRNGTLISRTCQDYVPAAIDYVGWNGKLWAIPYRIETHGIIYNKDHFREAGLDPGKPPKTWDELTAAAKALTKNGRYGFGITGGGEVGNTLFRSLPFIWMNGGDIITADMTKAVVNSPEAVKAVEFYTNFYKQGLSPKSTLENDGLALRRLFIAGTVSAYQSGQFDLPAIQRENPNVKLGAMTIPAPAGKQTAAVLGGWSYVVPKSAKNPEEARKFLQFLNTTENQGYYTDTFPAPHVLDQAAALR